MKSKGKDGENARSTNPYGHYRKRPAPTVEKFADFFDRQSGVPVLKQFFEGANATESWVHEYFPLVELEVHQAVTIGKDARRVGRTPDYVAVKARCPYLATIASDAMLKEIVECSQNMPKVKDLTAEPFHRVLNRSTESIKKWAQRKK